MRDLFEGDDDLLRRYLLGELSEEETARLEPRLLEDKGLLERAEAVEGDLLAEYDHGELTPEQEREVRKRLTATAEGRARLALVRNLHQIGNEVPVLPRRPRRYFVPVSALAATLLLAIGGLSVWSQLQGRFGQPPVPESRNHIRDVVDRTPAPDGAPIEPTPGQQIEEPSVKPPAVVETAPPPQERQPEPAILEVPLRSAERSDAGEDLLSREVSKKAEQILFRVPLREEGFTSYRIVLISPDGTKDVFPDLELRPRPSGRGVEFPVRGAEVSDGLYTIEVYGTTMSGDDELVGDQELKIQRR